MSLYEVSDTRAAPHLGRPVRSLLTHTTGFTPRLIGLPATGTDAHWHPAGTTPTALATDKASAGLRGSTWVKTCAGTKALTAPETKEGEDKGRWRLHRDGHADPLPSAEHRMPQPARRPRRPGADRDRTRLARRRPAR
ncbi:hypothetical protein GCM10009802_07730 [Streptomyces synnematoformans]|uniref:Beta-lactamase family protein n=1 Tax=Streptomyces synnematoformans TaxID=415721 RepID=A0ABN2XE93_9ACTN